MTAAPLRTLLTVGALLLLYTSTEAVASKTYFSGITLEVVVAAADVVVVAVPADPPRRIESIDVTPEGKAKDEVKWPPFHRVISRFEVKEVLRDESGEQAVTPGLVIEVDVADSEQQLHLHKLYYVERISKSPIYERYEHKGESKKPERILFLARSDDGLRFARRGAVELIEHRALVVAQLKKTKPLSAIGR